MKTISHFWSIFKRTHLIEIISLFQTVCKQPKSFAGQIRVKEGWLCIAESANWYPRWSIAGKLAKTPFDNDDSAKADPFVWGANVGHLGNYLLRRSEEERYAWCHHVLAAYVEGEKEKMSVHLWVKFVWQFKGGPSMHRSSCMKSYANEFPLTTFLLTNICKEKWLNNCTRAVLVGQMCYFTAPGMILRKIY